MGMGASTCDDFPKGTKSTVAEGAANICSNPTCRRPTVEPHSDPDKSLKTDEASYICAAAPGGPRYDPQQTPEERGSIATAIWLWVRCKMKVRRRGMIFIFDRWNVHRGAASLSPGGQARTAISVSRRAEDLTACCAAAPHRRSILIPKPRQELLHGALEEGMQGVGGELA